MQLLFEQPLIFMALLVGGMLSAWLARYLFAKKPAYCRGIVIAFGLIMLGMLIFLLIFLALYK